MALRARPLAAQSVSPRTTRPRLHMFRAQPALLPSRAPAGTRRAAGPRAIVRTNGPRRSAWHARSSLQHVRLSQPSPPSAVPSATGASVLRAAALSTEPVVSAHDAELLEWRQCWWPVAFTTDLDASKPSTFTLLGEKLVLWHDGAAWQAFADRCPHRLAPLSEGRVNEDGCVSGLWSDCARTDASLQSTGVPVPRLGVQRWRGVRDDPTGRGWHCASVAEGVRHRL